MAESHGILLVEDDRFQREPLEFLFQLRGYEVIAVGGAAEALEKLRAGFTPCVIVLDLMMPDMSVEDFRREQLNDVGLAKVPIILYSAAFDLPGAAERLGAVGHAAKPYAHRLLNIIAAHC